MPWNGSGSFNRTDGTRNGATTWVQAKGAGVNILAADHDTHDEDLADGLENALTRDGQNSPSADLPMATRKHTNVGNATARTNYAAAGQVADGGLVWGGTSTGAANTYAITPSPAIAAYTAGQTFRFLSHQANTDAVTLNVNALGAKDITKDGTTALYAGDVRNGQIVEVVYDGTRFQMMNVALRNNGMQLLGSVTASGGESELDVEDANNDWSLFSDLLLFVSDFAPATDDAVVQIQLSQASTYVTSTSYAYVTAVQSGFDSGGNAMTDTRSNSATVFNLSAINTNQGVGNAANEHFAGTYTLHGINSAIRKELRGTGVYRRVSGDVVSCTTGGVMQSGSAIDGVRLKFSVGTIDTGTFSIYGTRL